MNVSEIKDPRVRARIEAADAAQNGGVPQHTDADALPGAKAKAKGRLRQSIRPLMNNLETEFYGTICNKYPDYPEVRIQSARYRLGNGIWYKPDFTAAFWPIPETAEETFRLRPIAWEVKGPRAFRGGFENLKVAASLYPEVRWLLVWKDQETGEWQEQHILP